MRVTRGRLGVLLLGVVAAVGCGSSYDYTSDYSYGFSYSNRSSGSVAQPQLALSEEAISTTLAAQEAAAVKREAELRATLPAAPSLRETADAVRDCYAQNERDVADELIAAHPQLYSWDQAGSVVEISTNFRKSGFGGEIELSMTRKEGVTGPVAVAFPPGTYGVARTGTYAASTGGAADASPLVDSRDWNRPEDQRRYRHWPKAQDLAMLRAPVIYLPSVSDQATVAVPVACANFELGAPRADQAYTLSTFPANSRVDHLMQAICAGEVAPRDTEVQLAVWMTRDDISWQQFQQQGGHFGRLVTFGTSSPVLPGNAKGASKLLLDAGLNPLEQRFFDPNGAARPARSGDLPLQVAPADAPAPTDDAAPAEPAPQAPVELDSVSS